MLELSGIQVLIFSSVVYLSVDFPYVCSFYLFQYSENHVSKSIYAAFKITSPSNSGLLDEFLPNVCLAIWTTTPWTIPANAGEVMPCLLLIQWKRPASHSELGCHDSHLKLFEKFQMAGDG